MKPRSFLCMFAVLPLVNAGCILPFGPHDVRTALIRQSGVDLKPTLTVSADWLTLAIAAALVPFPVPVKHICWVEFGMYDAAAPEGLQADGVLGQPELPNWERIVRIRNGRSTTSAFVQSGEHPMNAIVVVMTNRNKVTIIKVVGRLDKLLQEGMGGGWGGMNFHASSRHGQSPAHGGDALTCNSHAESFTGDLLDRHPDQARPSGAG